MKKIDLLKKNITDQKDVIGILKDLNNVNDTLIEAYRVKEENLEKYIIILKEQLHNIQTLYIGII